MAKKILLAMDSFKGSLSSIEVETALEKGILKMCPDAVITKVPVADGGEGTVDAIVAGCQGTFEYADVHDPLGRDISAKYGISPGGIAVIEMSMASGIMLLKKEELNPMETSTYGTGEMILDALNPGANEIYIDIGGSATNDGGMGMACAFGVRFLDAEGKALPPKAASLAKIHTIDMSGMDSRIMDTKIKILSDVKNPLCGPTGASVVFGPQKGADVEMVHQLDESLRHYAQCIKEQLGKDVVDAEGAGAAGGLGAGLLVFTNAVMSRGIDEVLSIIKLEALVQGQDLVVTGEGRMDNQTAFGKTPVGVSAAAKKHGVPTVAVVGSLKLHTDAMFEKGISLIFDIVNEPMDLDHAIENAEELVANAGEQIGRLAQCWTYHGKK